MPFKDIVQPEVIDIENYLRLRKIVEGDLETALPWYHDPEVLYYSEGVREKTYDIFVIERMYRFLSSIGELYFIEIFENGCWEAIGDVTLSEQNMPIVLGEEKYRGKGIGTKIISKLIDRAKAIKLSKICIPAIYKYNIRSRNLFLSLGFVQVSENETEGSYELIME